MLVILSYNTLTYTRNCKFHVFTPTGLLTRAVCPLRDYENVGKKKADFAQLRQHTTMGDGGSPDRALLKGCVL